VLVQGHVVLFSQRELSIHLSENITSSSLLIDLDTTDELEGNNVVYAIFSITPEG